MNTLALHEALDDEDEDVDGNQVKYEIGFITEIRELETRGFIQMQFKERLGGREGDKEGRIFRFPNFSRI